MCNQSRPVRSSKRRRCLLQKQTTQLQDDNFDLMKVSGVEMTGDYRTMMEKEDMASSQHEYEPHGPKWGEEMPFHPLNHSAPDVDDDDDDMPDRRPASLREFFTAFWVEFRSLVQELIQYMRAKTWKKKVLTMLVTGCSFLVFYDLFFGGFIVQHLESFIFWMSVHSSSAVLAFIVLFVVATLIFIPPTFLVFGAGFAFSQALGFGAGVLAAILSCSIGSCIGAVLAFWRSRYLMRDLIELFSKRYPLIRAADRAIERKGLKIMFLLRLCPLLPFNGLNYCFGITKVSLEDFMLSLVGVLPFQIFVVVVGATTGKFALTNGYNFEYNRRQEIGFVFLVSLGIGTSIIALVYSWKVVKKELRKELQLTTKEFDSLLYPLQGAREIARQGGMEPSIEVTHLDQPDPDDDTSQLWARDDEEWFWIWA